MQSLQNFWKCGFEVYRVLEAGFKVCKTFGSAALKFIGFWKCGFEVYRVLEAML